MTKDATPKTDEVLLTDLRKLSEEFLPKLAQFLDDLPPEYRTQEGECLIYSIMLAVSAGTLQEMGVPDEDIMNTCENALDEDAESIILTPRLDTSEEN